MGVKRRVGKGRSGNSVINASDSNVTVRIYILKTNALTIRDQDGVSVTVNGLVEETKLIIEKHIIILYTVLYEYLSIVRGEERLKPTGIDIYYDPDEEFYSILFLFSLKKTQQLDIGYLRFYLVANAAALNVNLHIIYVSNFATESPMAGWDTDHVNGGFIAEYDKPKACSILPQFQDEQEVIEETVKKRKERKLLPESNEGGVV